VEVVVVVRWPLWLVFQVREGVVGSHFDFRVRKRTPACILSKRGSRGNSGTEKLSELDLRDDDWDVSRNKGGKHTLADTGHIVGCV
jgi:hypothetical protein